MGVLNASVDFWEVAGFVNEGHRRWSKVMTYIPGFSVKVWIERDIPTWGGKPGIEYIDVMLVYRDVTLRKPHKGFAIKRGTPDTEIFEECRQIALKLSDNTIDICLNEIVC